MPDLLPLLFLLAVAGTLYLFWMYFWGGVFVNGVRNLTTAIVLRRHRKDLSGLSHGRVGATGRCSVDSETLTAPLTATECLAYNVTMLVETVEHSDGTGGNNMISVDELEDAASFRLEDGVGTARVLPADAELRLVQKETVEGHYDDLPENVRSLMDRSEYDFDPVDAEIGAADIRTTTGKSRIEEHRLDDGNETFVFGGATRDDRGNTVIADPEGSLSRVEDLVMEPFLVTAASKTPTDVSTYAVRIVLGVIMLLGPIWFAMQVTIP